MSEMIIKSPPARPINCNTQILQASLELDFFFADPHEWSHGIGTPYPATPLSESRYDGVKCFDDCEPWTL